LKAEYGRSAVTRGIGERRPGDWGPTAFVGGIGASGLILDAYEMASSVCCVLTNRIIERLR
jgi:hypothetical protein